MAKLQKELKMGLLFITHDLGVVQKIADKVLVMRNGELVETAHGQSFFSNPEHEYSKQLLGAVPSFEKRGARLSATNAEVNTSSDLSQINGKAESDPLLSVDDLKVHFPIRAGLLKRTVDYVRAVDGVSLKLQSGQTLALVGESGSGKTTVGKAILRLVEASSGGVHFDGCDVLGLSAAEMREKRSSMQIVFQDPFSSMNPRMRIGDIIEEGMRALNILSDREQRRKRIRELLDQVGLPASMMSRYPHEFSGGQRQRVCIARALAVDPKVIICDEPTSALDVSVQAQVLNLLNDLQDELGVSYLFITHNMSVVAYLADTVAVMRSGKIVEQGVVDEVLHNPQQEYTQELLKAVPQLVL